MGLYYEGRVFFMKRRLISLILSLSFALAPVSARANSSQEDADLSLMQKIFGNMEDLSDSEYTLPYKDGTLLSDVREPLYLSENGGRIFGSGEQVWASSGTLPQTANKTFVIGGKSYALSGAYKILSAAEGDFDADGRRNQLAMLVAAKTSGNRSLLLLCAASAENTSDMVPIAVLYEGGADFYGNTGEFVNCMNVICADMNGDGYDEIITTTPMSGYAAASGDKYGFDKTGGSCMWSLKEENRTQSGWKSNDGWNGTPEFLSNSLQVWVDNTYLGKPGVTVSTAAADIDGDGYDDIVTAISAAKVQINANYASSMYAVYYLGGAPTSDERYAKRKNLTLGIGGAAAKDLGMSITTGDASGFDVTICDIDNSGTPTVFMSVKKTIHHWAAYSGDKMYTPSYYVFALDYNKDSGNFKTSTVYNGGIYHHGWVDGTAASDSDYVYNKKVTDCAPVRIGVLKDDFGLAEKKKAEGKTGIISSGTLIADQNYIPFVRYADGYTYGYYTEEKGSYTGSWSEGKDRGHGFDDTQCVFYNNGINVYDIKTANVSFDGKTYEDAALVRAHTNGGFKTYFLAHTGNGYTQNPGTALLGTSTNFAAAAMPDVDSDSVYLKYQDRGFFWADPVIVAALASPPYFGSLPSDMYENGQTTYGNSVASSAGVSESFTISAGAYLSVEVKAGASGTAAVFEAESEALESSSSEKENSLEVSYTQSFSASGGEDTVVLATVGYDAYLYTAYYAGENGVRAETPYVVYVPHRGSDSVKTASLTRSDYNAFAEYAAEVLPDLDDVFGHTPGKPETYPHNEPSGKNILGGSVMIHKSVGTFPAGKGSQTQSIEITKEKSDTTSAGMSVSAKLGGGIETSAENILKYVEAGTKITGGYVQEKEYERGRIETSAVGTSFEGTVFGQNDGFNADGGKKSAGFNWKLLHYVYDFNKENSMQRFPVVTYITSDVTQPEGTIPSAVTVSPINAASGTMEQVGPATPSYINKTSFKVLAKGVTREAYTALEGAPFGMSLYTGGTNIGSEGPLTFDIIINGNVKPGSYELYLNVGGVLSNKFTVEVTPYEERIWITADKTEIDFGSMRFDEVKGTPSAAAQTVTVSSIHNERLDGFAASLSENSPFEITGELSALSLAPKGADGDSATVRVAPKKGLSVGTHTDTLTVSNGQTAAYVTLLYTVTEPTVPGPPEVGYNLPIVNPVKIGMVGPKDDGGARITDYLYTIKGHENYISDGNVIWKSAHTSAQSGKDVTISVADTLTVGETYIIGVKAVNEYGEGSPVWYEFRVHHSEDDPGTVRNMKVYPEDGKITVTWDEPDYWGENEFVGYDDILFKTYAVHLSKNNVWQDMTMRDRTEEREYTFTGLENGANYEVQVNSHTTNRYSYSEDVIKKAVPSAEIITPSRPRKLAAELSYKQAKLTWEAPGATGNTDITGYRVSKDGGASWTDVSAQTHEYTFAGLTPNMEYDFAVCAVNSAGQGDAACTRENIPNSLAAPQLVTDKQPDIVGGLIRGYAQMDMVWKPVEGNNVTYEVRVDDGEWQAVQPIPFGGTLCHIFTGLENERVYTFYVRALDNEGAGPITETKALNSMRKPREIAAKPIINPEVRPRNGAMQLFGTLSENRYSLKYSVDGSSWLDFCDGKKIDGYENGKEYVVALCSQSWDEGNMPLRTTQYFTCTPSADIPDEPSIPVVNTFVGDDYVRVEWNVENDGGRPIQYYEVEVDYGEPIKLPATENSFVFNYTHGEKSYYDVSVYAVNEAGKSEGGSAWADVFPQLNGADRINVPKGSGSFKSNAYSLTYTYIERDEETEQENPVTVDISDHADWSMSADNAAITWDIAERRIVVGNIPDGVYNAVVTAKGSSTTYEKNVVITVGDGAKIVSAEQVSGGISVNLNLPQSFGKVTLCTAVYGAGGALAAVSVKEISSSDLTGGKITVPISTNGKTTKIMLLQDAKGMYPLCKSVSVTLK